MRRTLGVLLICFLTIAVIDAMPVHATSNVIYGGKWNLGTDDYAIKQVAFSRSGDYLVTEFQVHGRISTYAYIYMIEFQFGQDQKERKTLVLSGMNALLVNQTDSVVRGFTAVPWENGGDTWTSRTPISLLNNRIHFWVWAAVASQAIPTQWVPDPRMGAPVSQPISRVGQQSMLLNWAGTDSNGNAAVEIALPARVTVTLQPNSLASKTVLTIDGSPHNFNSSGSLSVMLDSGVNHAMTITFSIQDNSMRLRFDHWSDGSNSTDRTINVQGDTKLTVVYNLVTGANNGSIMDLPHTLDYLLVGIICTVALVLLYYRKRTSQADKPKRELHPQEIVPIDMTI